MNYAIYGAGVMGKRFLQNLRNSGEGSRAGCFVDRVVGDTVEGLAVVPPEKIPENHRIVIALGDQRAALEAFQQLKRLGHEHMIWYFSPEHDFTDKLNSRMYPCSTWNEDSLAHVEMHIMDGCNLNCKDCCHFSPLFSRQIPSFEERIADVRRLKILVPHIVRFFILGGEPLMNPEVGIYAVALRELLPETDICIVTNGLLIPSLSTAVFEDLRRSKVWLNITLYPPTERLLLSISQRLESEKLSYNFHLLGEGGTFNQTLSLSPNSIYPRGCISRDCVNIWNGKIARCPTLMYVERLNTEFHAAFPEDGILDLYDKALDGEKSLSQMLKLRVPLCDHCVIHPVPWERCGAVTQLSDFASQE